MPKPLATVGYVRVSTKHQADRGLSLKAQESRIRAQAAAAGLDIREIVADRGLSGKSLGNRPGAQRILEMVKTRQIAAVIVWKLDRITRSVRDLMTLVELLTANGVRLISITESLDTETPAGRMVVTILAAVAQMEREQIGERIRLAAQHKRETGGAWANAPFGWQKRGKRLVRNEREIAACRLAVRLRGEGLTYQEIADELNRRRIQRRHGGRWLPQNTQAMVTRYAARLKIHVRGELLERRPATARGYRTDGPAHRRARMKVPDWRRREIAKLGAMGLARNRRSGD
jgi:site-specific DNA recombinase